MVYIDNQDWQGLKKGMTPHDIAVRCITCKQGKWVVGKHTCKRKSCKYLAPGKASNYFTREE